MLSHIIIRYYVSYYHSYIIIWVPLMQTGKHSSGFTLHHVHYINCGCSTADNHVKDEWYDLETIRVSLSIINFGKFSVVPRYKRSYITQYLSLVTQWHTQTQRNKFSPFVQCFWRMACRACFFLGSGELFCMLLECLFCT